MLYVIGTKYYVFEKTKKIAVGIDFIIALTVVGIYLVTMKVVRDYRMNSQNRGLLSNVDRTITRLASKILLTILVFYGAYIVISIFYFLVHKKFENSRKSWLNFALHFGYVLTYCNSFVNAVLFLTMNKKAKSKIFEFFRISKETDSNVYLNASSESSGP